RERWRKDLRQEHHDRAVEIRRAHADRDERKHVERAVKDRVPATDEERPAAREDDRRAQDELRPTRYVALHPLRSARHHVPHRYDENWYTQNRANPEAPRHVAQLGIIFLPGRGNVLRLQRHPADRAITRLILLDLRMHRAGVDDLRRVAENRIALQRHAAFRATARRIAFHALTHRAKILLRRLVLSHDCLCLRRKIMLAVTTRMLTPVLGDKLVAAVRRAEIKLLSLALDYRRCALRMNFHPADRISGDLSVRVHDKNGLRLRRRPKRRKGLRLVFSLAFLSSFACAPAAQRSSSSLAFICLISRCWLEMISWHNCFSSGSRSGACSHIRMAPAW